MRLRPGLFPNPAGETYSAPQTSELSWWGGVSLSVPKNLTPVHFRPSASIFGHSGIGPTAPNPISGYTLILGLCLYDDTI